MSRYNPHFPHAEDVFKAAQLFAQRCLLKQESLLLEDQLLWTKEHFEALKVNYVQRPDEGDRDFYAKLKDQLAVCSTLDVALMAEIFWIVELGPNNLLPLTKIARMETIWEIKPPSPFPINSPFLADTVLTGLGSGGMGFNQYLPSEVTFAVDAFSEFVEKPSSERESLLADGVAFAEWLDSVPSGKGRQLYHALCHLLFPDMYERIFSQSHKNKVARLHKVWTPEMKQSRPALDAALLALRERLEIQHPGQVDYYALPVGSLMPDATDNNGVPGKADGEHLEVNAANQKSDEPVQKPGSNRDEAIPTLRMADNLILFGPPGTGKTYEMERRMQAAFDNGEEFAFVAFHPSYAYEDFMGGLRPITKADGTGLSVVFHKGPFLLLCEKAHSHPTEQFTLFIDEINRANVAKVFGELITLIEPSKRVIAGSKPNDAGMWVTLPYTNEPFSVPDNLNIVATMNTADRSVSMMDLALRRRFRFQECLPEPTRIEPAYCGAVHLPTLLQTINDRLEFLLDRDHLIGHALFMGITDLPQLQRVIAQSVVPLLQEYFFEDTERVRLVLTGKNGDSVFFSTRKLTGTKLFPGHRGEVGDEPRIALVVGQPDLWTEMDIRSLYEEQTRGAAQVNSDPIGDAAVISQERTNQQPDE